MNRLKHLFGIHSWITIYKERERYYDHEKKECTQCPETKDVYTLVG